MNTNWDTFFFKMCKIIASKSKDPRTQVGCVIVGPDHEIRSTGYNSPPRGIDDIRIIGQTHTFHADIIKPLPDKYHYFEHAERNAIYNAARIGVPLEGCILYVPGAPCSDCSRAIIQSGIVMVKIESDKIPEHWKHSCKIGQEMMLEAGIWLEG